MQKLPKLRIKGPGEYDRFDNIVRFKAWSGKQPVAFSISSYALSLIMQHRDRPTREPEQAFALAGRIIDDMAEHIFDAGGREFSKPYHIDVGDLPLSYRPRLS